MTTRNDQSERPLTDLQQAILDVLWKQKAATAEQVRAGILPKHPLKDSSVRTLLRRLAGRGYVKYRSEGNTYIYEAAAPPRKVATGAVRQLIERFWAGSAEEFVAGMVDENVLSPEALQRLADKVREKQS